MRIVIVGAGFTGLTAALKLSQKGHQVTIFEKEKRAGGLAGGFKETNWQWPLDFFYRHLFNNDQTAKKLLKEIGTEISWSKPKTSVFKNGQIYRFDSSLSILSFPYFSFLDKIRTGLASLCLKTINHWQPLEKITASRWLPEFYGEKVYQTIWLPLLKGKFGAWAEKIPMAWFWARIKKRTTCLGYPQGGFQSLANKLVDLTKKNGGQFYFQKEIKNFQELKGKFDKILFTIPVSIFLKIMRKELPQDYQQKLSQLKMIGALNLVLTLKKSFLKDGTYWLNVNEENFPFVGAVEHTNFINKSYYHHHFILYILGYYPQNHRFFKMNKENLLKEFLPFLPKINPDFKKDLIEKSYLFANLYAQPLIPLNYSTIIPPFKTPVKNVFLACMQQVYPWDRGLNYAIKMGEKIANEVLQK
jgi:protoporphyrinogen oxidase